MTVWKLNELLGKPESSRTFLSENFVRSEIFLGLTQNLAIFAKYWVKNSQKNEECKRTFHCNASVLYEK